MALPKKASRPIEVNGRQYRWMVKRVTKSEKDWVRVTIEDQETGEIVQSRRHGWEGDAPMITPRDVKEIILARFTP